jgi:hypothetical protein
MFGGMQISTSPHATEERPIFPDKKWSKRRRRRVIGKYGSWTRRFPAAFQFGNKIVMHPALYRELQRRTTTHGGLT